MGHPLHDAVRQRYSGRCGYCGVSEVDAGGELTVDHFRPLNADGGEELDNLVYSCARCNLYKGAYFPTAEEFARGLRLLHPLLDVVDQHFACDDQTGRLEGLTQTGAFHLRILRLNRPELVAHRLRHRFNMMFEANLTLLRTEIEHLRRLTAELRKENQSLRDLLGLNPPQASSGEAG